MKSISYYEAEATVYYFIWYAVYVALGLSAVALPGLAAIGVGDELSGKFLAGAGGIAAAALGFLRPFDYATKFDQAIAELRMLQADIELKQLPPSEQAEKLKFIFGLMAFRYEASASNRVNARNAK